MRKRRSARLIGHLLTPNQVEQLTLPIHMALRLLESEHFSEAHAADLGAFLSIGQVAAELRRKLPVVEIGAAGAEILIAMRDRARQGRGWFASASEREVLTRAVVTMDRFLRTVQSCHLLQAMESTNRICELAKANGAGLLDVAQASYVESKRDRGALR